MKNIKKNKFIMKRIKPFEEFINESKVHYFGPSAEDERRAARAESMPSLKPWKNGNAFKQQLKSNFLKDKINKISSGRVTIQPGNWRRLTFKTSKSDFDLETIKLMWNDDLERFGKVYTQAKDIRIEEFTQSSFILTF